MGQLINVAEPVVIDAVAIFDTDRSLSGQDGQAFDSAASAADAEGFPAELAGRLFAQDPSVANVYVFSNTLSVRREGGWPADALDTAAATIKNFFVVYEENKSA